MAFFFHLLQSSKTELITISWGDSCLAVEGTPLLQINLLPDLLHVNFLLPAIEMTPCTEQGPPVLVAAAEISTGITENRITIAVERPTLLRKLIYRGYAAIASNTRNIVFLFADDPRF